MPLLLGLPRHPETDWIPLKPAQGADPAMGLGVEPEMQEDRMANDAISKVIAAAKSVGFDEQSAMQQGNSPEMHAALLKAAAQGDWGATDEGISTIVGVSQMLGAQSPYRSSGGQAKPSYATPWEDGQQ